jgi:predicted Zn-dependent peptidase
MSQKFIIQLTLTKTEVEKVRERFRQNLEMDKEEFNDITTEEAIEDLFYFEKYNSPYRHSVSDLMDLRSNVKVKRLEKKNGKREKRNSK